MRDERAATTWFSNFHEESGTTIGRRHCPKRASRTDPNRIQGGSIMARRIHIITLAGVTLSAALLANNPAGATGLDTAVLDTAVNAQPAGETSGLLMNVSWRGHMGYFHRPFFHRAFAFHRFHHRPFFFHRFHRCYYC